MNNWLLYSAAAVSGILRTLFFINSYCYILQRRLKKEEWIYTGLFNMIWLSVLKFLGTGYSDALFFGGHLVLLIICRKSSTNKSDSNIIILLLMLAGVFYSLAGSVFVHYFYLRGVRSPEMQWAYMAITSAADQVIYAVLFLKCVWVFVRREKIIIGASFLCFGVLEGACFSVLSLALFRYVHRLGSRIYYELHIIFLVYGVMILLMVQYSFLLKNIIKNRDLADWASVLKNQEIRSEDLQEVYQELSALRHDLKNQFQILETLKEKDSLKDYAEGVEKYLLPVYSFGCKPLDAALTVKNRMFFEHSVKFEVEICPLHDIILDEQLITAIVINLLDNAYKAVENEHVERRVSLEIRRNKKMLMICCENRTTQTEVIIPQRLSAEHTDGHGYGLSIIKKAAEKMNGHFQAEIIDGVFTANIMIPFETRSMQ